MYNNCYLCSSVIYVHPENAIALRKQIYIIIGDLSLANNTTQKGYINAKTNFALETILESFAQSIATV